MLPMITECLKIFLYNNWKILKVTYEQKSHSSTRAQHKWKLNIFKVKKLLRNRTPHESHDFDNDSIFLGNISKGIIT